METKNQEPPTELAIGVDGTVYVGEQGLRPGTIMRTRRFLGWALTATELRSFAQERKLSELHGIVMASDGRFYASAGWIGEDKRRGRRKFAAVAMTAAERSYAISALHTLAFNITIAVDDKMKAHRKATPRKRAQHSRKGRR